MKFKSIVLFLLGLTIIFTAPNTQAEYQTSTQPANEHQKNKLLLKKAMDALFQNYSEEEMRKYFTADYIQHNPHVPTGLDSVIGLLPVLKEANLGYKTHRVIADGDLIVTHTTYHNAEVFGANKVIAFDIWRIEEGKVAEHWDAIIPYYPETASGRTQTNGLTQITDLEKTEENKTLVKNFVQEVLIERKTSKMNKYIRNGLYDQHNPVVQDGPEALSEAIKEITNDKIHRVIGEGNFVLTQSEGSWKGKPYAIYDLFRVEDGYIVEHWDVLQEIPAKMAHENGMF